jgi:hypothetical protein
VPAWGNYSFAFGPLVALAAVGVIMLLLRWTFSSGRSLVARQPRPGAVGEYGLLVRIAAPATVIEAELIRRYLTEQGVRATLAPTVEGPAVMVFPDDAPSARLAMRDYHPPTG